MKFRTIDLILAALFAALMAIGANIVAFIPAIQGVPLTFQTFFAILAGAVLGSRIGSVSMVVYTLVGLVGVPVFSDFSGGLGVIFSNTFGFILSFIVIAYITGKIVEASKQPGMVTFMMAGAVGLALNYIIGTTYMYAALNLWLGVPMTYTAAWIVMVPFLIKDIVFTFIAALIAPRIYWRLQRVSHSKSNRAA